MTLFTSGGLGLGLVSSGLGLGLKNLVLFTSLMKVIPEKIWDNLPVPNLPQVQSTFLSPVLARG